METFTSSLDTELVNQIFPKNFNLLCLNKSVLLYNLEKSPDPAASRGTHRGWFLALFGFLSAGLQNYCAELLWVL